MGERAWLGWRIPLHPTSVNVRPSLSNGLPGMVFMPGREYDIAKVRCGSKQAGRTEGGPAMARQSLAVELLTILTMAVLVVERI